MKILLRKGILFIVILLTCAGTSAYSQAKFEFGVNMGLFIYQGDLAPSRMGSFKTPGPAFSIFAGRILNNSFSLRTNLAFGKLKGDDAKYSSPEYRQQRNFNFRSPVLEISELLVWNPLGKNEWRRFSPYLFGGAGLSFLHIKRDWSRFNAEYFSEDPTILAGIAADSNHVLQRTIPVFPLGIGLRYAVSARLSITAESSYRLTSTDYIDGFSKAADPARKDHYDSYSIGVVYRVGQKDRLKCPIVRD